MEQLLPVPLSLATDCAELTADTAMGILSIHGATLHTEDVEHLCTSISRQGHGLIGPSTYLSPYQALLIGQHDTLDRLEQAMPQYLPEGITLRRRPNHWPPLHTPLVWERNIPNRTAMAMHHITGGDREADSHDRLLLDGCCQLRRMEQPHDPGRLDRPSPAAVGCYGKYASVGGRDRAPRGPRAQIVSDGLRAAQPSRDEATENRGISTALEAV